MNQLFLSIAVGPVIGLAVILLIGFFMAFPKAFMSLFDKGERVSEEEMDRSMRHLTEQTYKKIELDAEEYEQYWDGNELKERKIKK